MNTRTTILACAAAILLAAAPALPAQAEPPAPAAEPAPVPAAGYLYGDATADILVADLVGFGATFAGVGLNFLAGAVLGSDGTATVGDQVLASAVTSLTGVTQFAFESPDALPMAVADGLLLGGEALAADGYGLYSREQQWFYWARNNLGMYKAYDGYATVRQRSAAWDNSGFRRYGALELMREPFRLENYGEPLLWGAVGITLAGIAGQWALGADPLSTAPATTGAWYLDATPVAPGAYWVNQAAYFLSANTLGAIGEEGVYRGFLHEELTVRVGKDAATLIDTGAFALMHLITDIARGMSWDKILVHVGTVSLNNLIFDLAYDQGGLPLAVACHAAANFAGNILAGFLYAGVPVVRGTN